MERKLSQKAAQMRQRLFNRDRAATMNSSKPTTSTLSNRSRSATTPISTQPGLTWDNTTATRYYHFTDEPGYFRPASPLLHRQEVEEDLEDNVKHACSLLVESIERGLPIWPSFHTTQSNTQQMAQAPYETRPNLHPMTQLSLSPVALDNLIPTTWDSGTSPPVPSRAEQSFSFSASANTGRFYGRRLSSPPEEDERGRPRGRSFATDSTSPRSRSRSRSSTPGFFPYSPPQQDTWARDTTQIFESPDAQSFPTEEAFLGAEGITWLRASLDMNCEPSNRALPGPGPAPRRFYSVRQAPKEKFQWDAFEVQGSRESGLYRGSSIPDLEMEGKRAHEISYSVRDDVPFYSLFAEEPVRRRKRASELLKKLTGLGLRRREPERRAVEAM